MMGIKVSLVKYRVSRAKNCWQNILGKEKKADGEKYETKIKDYTKDIEQNINQEAVLQTIKKCKRNLCTGRRLSAFLYGIFI